MLSSQRQVDLSESEFKAILVYKREFHDSQGYPVSKTNQPTSLSSGWAILRPYLKTKQNGTNKQNYYSSGSDFYEQINKALETEVPNFLAVKAWRTPKGRKVPLDFQGR